MVRVCVLFMSFCATSFGTRILDVIHCGSAITHILISNPSSRTQTIQIEVTSSGGTTIQTAPTGAFANEATECPSTTQCQLKSTYRTLAAGTGIAMSFDYSAFPSPTGSANIRIQVEEDKGHIIGRMVCSFNIGTQGYERNFDLNQGLPF